MHLKRMLDPSLSFNSAHLTQLHFRGFIPVQYPGLGQEELPTEEYYSMLVTYSYLPSASPALTHKSSTS